VAMIDDAIAELTDPVDRAPVSAQRRAARSRARATAAQRSRSLPDHGPARRGRAVVVVAALAALAMSGAGFAAFKLRGAAEATIDEPEPSETAQGAPVSATGDVLRLITRDDGELILRTLVPEVIHAGAVVRAHLAIKTKLGSPFPAKQVVVTIEDPHHNATALTAGLQSDHPGHYVFRHAFAEPGSYVVRIFPSETETVSTLELDVAP
jgi:hypothetical protein